MFLSQDHLAAIRNDSSSEDEFYDAAGAFLCKRHFLCNEEEMFPLSSFVIVS